MKGKNKLLKVNKKKQQLIFHKLITHNEPLKNNTLKEDIDILPIGMDKEQK